MDAKYTAIIAAAIAGSATLGAAFITTFFKDHPAPAAQAESSVPAQAPQNAPPTVQSVPVPVGTAPAPEPVATPVPQDQPGGAPSLAIAAQATGPISVRAAPQLDATRIFEIPGGRTFTIVDANASANWVKITFEGQTGFVRKGQNYVVMG